MLQGPVGPFFRELSEALIRDGAEVTQLTFNKADFYFTSEKVSLPVTVRKSDFAENIRLHLKTGFDVIVLFGSERPAHRIARKVATEFGTQVLSFEEGYIRPGSVTLERGGNNASSPISKADLSMIEASGSSHAEAANYRGFWPMIWHGANYYFRREIFATDREREFHHRDTPIVPEAYFWIRNVVRKVVEGHRHYRISRHIITDFPGDFFLVPLQVPSDSNIRQAANGWTTPKLIHETIRSFAQSAPKTSRLVFKIHPMSRGHSSDHKLIYNLADTFRVGSRTIVLHDGSLGDLTRNSAGMITINSTSGLSAIHHGIPLLTMGKSIYAHPELACLASTEADIDSFWTKRHVAPPALRNAFLSHVRREALLPGDFYASRGRATAVRHARASILQTIFEQKAR